MSGRLVILRHKSWHVWNQDNREKVLRDERLHREEQEKKEKEEREKIRERNFSVLNGEEKGQDLQPVVLSEKVDITAFAGDEFDQLIRRTEIVREKRKEVSPHAHPEFIKEKEQAEQKRKRREGLEDWQLGKGLFESQGSKLWYNKTGGKEPSIDSAKVEHFHRSNDPMQKYMVHHDTSVIESKDQDSSSGRYAQISSIGEDVSHKHADSDVSSRTSEESSHSSSKKKKRKKSSSSHKHKKRKDKHDRKHKEHKHVEKDSRHPQITEEASKQQLLEALRQKRLEREKAERKRAAMLLAEADIFGAHAAGAGAYNQQYNPNLARNR